MDRFFAFWKVFWEIMAKVLAGSSRAKNKVFVESTWVGTPDALAGTGQNLIGEMPTVTDSAMVNSSGVLVDTWKTQYFDNIPQNGFATISFESIQSWDYPYVNYLTAD